MESRPARRKRSVATMPDLTDPTRATNPALKRRLFVGLSAGVAALAGPAVALAADASQFREPTPPDRPRRRSRPRRFEAAAAIEPGAHDRELRRGAEERVRNHTRPRGRDACLGRRQSNSRRRSTLRESRLSYDRAQSLQWPRRTERRQLEQFRTVSTDGGKSRRR